jgi:prepilin-type N-terminal cleavage/methylation domain-containing protein
MSRTRLLLIEARGFSLVELVVVVGILSLILVSAISRLNSGYRSADSAAAELVANLRLCRAKAVSSGYHYQLGVTGPSSYSVNRMLPPTSGSDWTVDGGTPTLTVTLPGNVRFTDGTGRYEFNTRGVMVVRAGETFVPTKILNDSALNNSVFVQVWTSGQVN